MTAAHRAAAAAQPAGSAAVQASGGHAPAAGGIDSSGPKATPPRLNAAWLADVRGRAAPPPGGLDLPGYDPMAHGIGLVHLGTGAFHKAHQADYTDRVLAMRGGDWRILGASLRSTSVADALNEQDGLYTLLVRDGTGSRGHVIGSIAHVVAASRDARPLRDALAAEETRVITLTVTEKAYGIDRATRRVVESHAAIAHDLAHPEEPVGAVGLLVWAIRRRRTLGMAQPTILCCDNLPENGRLLQAGVCDLAERLEPGLGAWIEAHVAFPCSMVDRITPASTPRTLADAAALTGCEDRAAVETEPFTMWVIEDHFPAGRPAWELAGALLVGDVAPYEHMKLRMLNGAHSLLAYAGHVGGHRYVRDAMADPALAGVVQAYMRAAAATLAPLDGVDFADYATQLCARFSNPAIAHETYQIAMDGTEKLPQRILAAAVDDLARNPASPDSLFAFATAAWMRYCLGVTEAGQAYALRDPRADEIARAVRGCEHDAPALMRALLELPGLFPGPLKASRAWQGLVSGFLGAMMARGMHAALLDCPVPRVP